MKTKKVQKKTFFETFVVFFIELYSCLNQYNKIILLLYFS